MKKVLFLCTGNSCRSQMAEGFLRYYGGEQFEVFSAGTEPAGLNPRAIEVMLEAGIDISAHRSKSLNEFAGQAFDYAITVCDQAKDSCPVFSGTRSRLHWSFEDPARASGPADEVLSVFRRVRDEIAAKVKQFASEHQNKH